jgi:hypothetical protein
VGREERREFQHSSIPHERVPGKRTHSIFRCLQQCSADPCRKRGRACQIGKD